MNRKASTRNVALLLFCFAATDEDLFLIIHNIDGTMLRSEKVQSVLSHLAHVPNVHVIASVDHINAPLGRYYTQKHIFTHAFSFYFRDTTFIFTTKGSSQNLRRFEKRKYY